MFLPLTGLALLVFAIALGFIKKINVGLIAIACAFILALLGGIPKNS